MIAPLKQAAIERAAREIRAARYLSCQVSDEELAERAVSVYQEAVRNARTARKQEQTAGSQRRRPA